MSRDDHGNNAASAEVRSRAIHLHDEVAEVFEGLYQTAERDPYATSFSYGRKKIQEVLDSVLQALPRGRVLDVGCGTGHQLRAMAQRGLECFGIEPAENMRTIAEKTCPKAHVLAASVFEMPFDEAMFDLVVCVEVLRYLTKEDVLRAYRKIRRVLKPGGTLFATFVNRYSMDGFWLYDRAAALVSPLVGKKRTHCTFTTPRRTRKEILAAGFARVRMLGRLFGAFRVPYHIYGRLGAALARHLEPIDDAICRAAWSTPLSGHLIAVARA